MKLSSYKYMWRFILKLLIHFRKQKYFWLLVYSLLIAFVLAFIINYKTEKDYHYKVGDFAKSDIKANKTIEVEDIEATESNRNEAESRTPAVYDYDSKIYEDLAVKINTAFKLMRSKWNTSSYDELKQLFEEQVARVVPSNIFKVFFVHKFSWRLKKAILRAISLVPRRYIVDTKQSLLSRGKTKDIIISNIHTQGENKERVLNSYFVSRTSITKDAVYDLVISQMQSVLNKFSMAEKMALKSFIKILIIPNLTYNSEKTSSNRKKARESVKKSIIKVHKGEIIVRDGESIERQHILIFSALKNADKSKENAIYYLTQVLIFFLVFFVISLYILNYSTMSLSHKDLWFIGVVIIFYTLAINFWILSIPILKESLSNIHNTVWLYLFPFLLPVILAKVILNIPSVTFIAVLSALIVAVLGENNVLPLYIVVSAYVVDIWIRNITSRISLLKMSVPVFLFQGIIAYSFGLLNVNNIDFNWLYPLYLGLAGVGSAIISVLLTEALVPLFESMFRYTSNLKLLEFANFNHPLLRKLIISAPGSYQHSVAVGQLASEAAQSIGANALLTRVGAYFHDIGKLKNPYFFIENQTKGDNPHDRKSPEESRDILRSHISYGLELARKYRLGKQITDILEQHHGTSLMKFFYKKALDIGLDVKKDDFRYFGPKPQTREAVLVMIADSIEAASRTLEDFSRTTVFNMVDGIVKDMFQDGQFDETDISPKKLRRIVQIYTKVVIAMNHNRIKYDKLEDDGGN